MNTDDYPLGGLLKKNNELSYVIHTNNIKYEKVDKYIVIKIGGWLFNEIYNLTYRQ